METTLAELYDSIKYVEYTFNNFKTNELVRKLEENKDITKFDKIQAYIIRDFEYHKDKTVKQLFHDHCVTVDIFIQDNKRFEIRFRDFMNKVEDKIKNHDDSVVELIKTYDESMQKLSDTELEKQTRYNDIMDMVQHECKLCDIYDRFTEKEIDILGW